MRPAGIHLPPLGKRVPRRGNRVTQALGNMILRGFRWRVEGEIPDREKLLVVVAPHTTGWDFPICIVTLIAIGVRVSWLGVDWMFRYPMMRKMGGIPIDRETRRGVVDQTIETFKSRDSYFLGLSPEGSRKKVVPWKTGFYHIATGAAVPLLLIVIDQQAKRIQVGPMIEPSGDYEADMQQHVHPVYAEFVDRHPDQFGF